MNFRVNTLAVPNELVFILPKEELNSLGNGSQDYFMYRSTCDPKGQFLLMNVANYVTKYKYKLGPGGIGRDRNQYYSNAEHWREEKQEV